LTLLDLHYFASTTNRKNQRNINHLHNMGLYQGSATFFNKRVFLLHLPAHRVGVEPQNVDTVSFFMRFHRDLG